MQWPYLKQRDVVSMTYDQQEPAVFLGLYLLGIDETSKSQLRGYQVTIARVQTASESTCVVDIVWNTMW